jgi:hypothetical protein
VPFPPDRRSTSQSKFGGGSGWRTGCQVRSLKRLGVPGPPGKRSAITTTVTRTAMVSMSCVVTSITVACNESHDYSPLFGQRRQLFLRKAVRRPSRCCGRDERTAAVQVTVCRPFEAAPLWRHPVAIVYSRLPTPLSRKRDADRWPAKRCPHPQPPLQSASSFFRTAF